VRIDIDAAGSLRASRDVQAQLTGLAQASISLGRDELTGEDLGMLPDLSRHSRLASLHVCAHAQTCTDVDAAALSGQLAVLTALQRLEWRGLPINLFSSLKCTHRLATLTTLTSLSLQRCNVQPGFTSAFGNAATSMTSLVALDLSCNESLFAAGPHSGITTMLGALPQLSC
jgi:hypothetical protein